MTERAARLQTASTFKTTSLRMNLSPSQLRVLKEQQRKGRVSAKEKERNNRVLDKEQVKDDARSDTKESRRRARQKSRSDRERMTKKRGERAPRYSCPASRDRVISVHPDEASGGSPDGELQREVEKRFDLESEGDSEREDEERSHEGSDLELETNSVNPSRSTNVDLEGFQIGVCVAHLFLFICVGFSLICVAGRVVCSLNPRGTYFALPDDQPTLCFLQTFNIRIAHMSLSIARLYAPGPYLDAITSNHQLTFTDPIVYSQRTEEFNLLHREGRANAGKAIWALLAYLKSGEALVGRLSEINSDSSRCFSHSDYSEITEQPLIHTRTTVPGVYPAWYGPHQGSQPRSSPTRGIFNFGSSCYMSVVLQALAATYELSALCAHVPSNLTDHRIVKSTLYLTWQLRAEPCGEVVQPDWLRVSTKSTFEPFFSTNLWPNSRSLLQIEILDGMVALIKTRASF